jgi:hypothetical protein
MPKIVKAHQVGSFDVEDGTMFKFDIKLDDGRVGTVYGPTDNHWQAGDTVTVTGTADDGLIKRIRRIDERGEKIRVLLAASAMVVGGNKKAETRLKDVEVLYNGMIKILEG